MGKESQPPPGGGEGIDHSLTPEEPRWAACIYAVPNLPLVEVGDDIAHLIFSAATEDRFVFRDGDVIVVAQKIVSKAEGAVVRLNDVEPSPRAQELAQATGRDPRLCEVYVRESREILGTKDRMVITRHRLGFICTNAGVDRSNIGPEAGELALLLPRDPDASARAIRDTLRALTGCDVAVIISDSFGKPDRDGAIGVAIGLAGIRHLEEHERYDLFGRLRDTSINLVDELAGAAMMIGGETGERLPVVVIRGIPYTRDDSASIRKLLV
jgi:coenzyme F420-0:L-glutamate ligase / coenzyme F420-1:gamma-L-glutamate ligase